MEDKRTIPVRGDVLDDLDALWGQLDDLLDEVADKLGYQAPPHARAFGAQRRRGGASGTNAPGASASPAEWRTATIRTVRWIRDHYEQIEDLGMTETEEFLTDLIHQLRGRYMPHDKPHWWHTKRLCDVCQTRSIGVTWKHGHLFVACTECGHEVVGAHDPMRSYWEGEYLRAAVEVQRDMLAHAD